MIQLKQSEFNLPGLERHTEKLFPFYLNYDKPCGELVLGENCIKIISQDKSNYLGMFLEIHLIPKWRLSQMIWVELHENEASRAKRR